MGEREKRRGGRGKEGGREKRERQKERGIGGGPEGKAGREKKKGD